MDEGFKRQMIVIKEFMGKNKIERFDMIHFLYHHYDWLLSSEEKKTVLFIAFCTSSKPVEEQALSSFARDHGLSLEDFATTNKKQIDEYRHFLNSISVDDFFIEIYRLAPGLFSLERYSHRINAPYPPTIQ